jgi:enediyne polyketide synthase
MIALCEETEVSAAHAGDLTIGIAGAGTLGCDIEPVTERPIEVWRDILGLDRFDLAQLIVKEAGESISTAATRVWTAIESMKKAGLMVGSALVFDSIDQDGWVRLESGSLAIASFVGKIRGVNDPLAIAVLAEPDM